jgi:hypothetical protein
MSRKAISCEGDIDKLTRGDIVEFFPTVVGPDYRRAVFLGYDPYGKGSFAYECRQEIKKAVISRTHLRPGAFETITIQERVTISCPPIGRDDMICFTASMGEDSLHEE